MRFSVIIPLYNKAAYVEKTIASVLAQTFTDYELIIVDDGSTDGGGGIAARILKEAYPQRLPEGEGSCIPAGEVPIPFPFGEGRGEAFLLRQHNAGVSAARNNGVAASHGDYLCFLDADDWWEPTFLEKIDSLIKEYPDAGIFGTNYYYVKSGRRQVRLDIPTGYINYCKVYADAMQMPLTSISVAVPRPVFDEVGGFKSFLMLGEDFDVWIRIALKHKVAFLNEPLAYYNQDVDVKQRGIGRLKRPESHMLWNLGYLAEEEKLNPDYKRLIDNLRVYGLMPYYLSKEYRTAAKQELTKVDWSKQPSEAYKEYQRPVWLLRSKQQFMKLGSKVKQWLIKNF